MGGGGARLLELGGVAPPYAQSSNNSFPDFRDEAEEYCALPGYYSTFRDRQAVTKRP
jgi:hypothetical protein